MSAKDEVGYRKRWWDRREKYGEKGSLCDRKMVAVDGDV
jgi:hypothetical protein